MSGKPFIGKPIVYTAPDTGYKYRGVLISWSGAGIWVDFGGSGNNVYFTWREANKYIL